MKATDLMVGDWVICNHYQDKPFTKQFGVVDFAKGEYEFCEPIPLTEEILVKNGFEHTMPYNDYALGELSLYEGGDGYMVNGFVGLGNLPVHCDYVHTLQHLLRLCRIEKEIEL